MNQENSGAMFAVSGFVPVNATWSEDIYFTQDGVPLDISEMDWKLTLRRCGGATEAPFLTLSTDDGTLSIVDDDDDVPSILRILVPVGGLSTSYIGDFVCDIASRDAQDTVTLWGHGVVTIRPNPVSF